MKNNLYVFGHQKPDTDTICSAIALANLEQALGNEATAYKLGNVNKETAYALNYFGVKEPATLSSVNEDCEVALVDHNEFSQSAQGIEKASIKMIIDHHKVKFESKDPVFFIAEPIGCTSSIIYKLYKQNDVEITKKLAGMMLSAIISDTLLFKSPTCTEEDKKIATKLAQIAEVDLTTYGTDMLKAGTDISDFTPFQVINIDSKEFSDKNAKFEISQVNAVDLDSVFSRQSELEDAIQKEIKDKNLDFYMFAATDILNANSKIIAIGNKADTVEKAFGVTLDNNTAMLDNVVSRKKQMLPNILNNLD